MVSKWKNPESCHLGVGAQRTLWDLKVISSVKILQRFRHGYVVYRERIQHGSRAHDSVHDHEVEVCLGKRLRKPAEARTRLSG